MSIVELAQELERLKATSNDVVASTTDMKMVAEGAVGGGLELNIAEYGDYPLTEHAHGQLADKTGIPKRYYDAMRGAGYYDLAAANVNRWLGTKAEARLVRIADGRVRALLSDRYRVIDNYDLALMVMDRAKEHGATVLRADLSDTRMYVKLIVPEYKAALAGGDDVIPGLVVSNSEVGAGAFRVEPFLYRLICSNGMIGETGLYKIHVGERMKAGELVLSDETRKLKDAALWSSVRDVIDSTFDVKVLRAIIEQMRESKDKALPKPQDALDVVVKDLRLSDSRRDELLRHFGDGSTTFDLVNATTRLAQDIGEKDYEQQIAVERYAGKLLVPVVA